VAICYKFHDTSFGILSPSQRICLWLFSVISYVLVVVHNQIFLFIFRRKYDNDAAIRYVVLHEIDIHNI
jgi:hypothetical protein